MRLALFADMMKSKPWTPATLKEVGGTTGVGVAFLEESLSSRTAPPERRYHERAARAVLKTLLLNVRLQCLVDQALIIAAAGVIDLSLEPVDDIGIEANRDSCLAG